MKPLVDDLLGRMRGVFGSIRDPRNGSNSQYALDDILMAAFSVFFMQSPSFLDHQRMAASSYGRHACSALFGVDPLPTDNHIRK